MDSHDEDYEGSIHDLSHAPELPEEFHSYAITNSPGQLSQLTGTNRRRLWSTESAPSFFSPRQKVQRTQSLRPRVESTDTYSPRSASSSSSLSGTENRKRTWSAGNNYPSTTQTEGTQKYRFRETSDRYTEPELAMSGIPEFSDSSADIYDVEDAERHQRNIADATTSLRPRSDPTMWKDSRRAFDDDESISYSTSEASHSAKRGNDEANKREQQFVVSSKESPSELMDEEIENDDDKQHGDDDENDDEMSMKSLNVVCCNRLFYLYRQMPKVYEMAAFVARYAPCFCCIGYNQLQTDRLILGRLNILLAFLSLYQIISSLFIAVVTLSPTLLDRNLDPSADITTSQQSGVSPILWNMDGAIYLAGVFALIVFISAILTWRVVKSVNLVGAIRYLWALSWIIPFETYSMVHLFDYFNCTSVWVKHWWRDSSLAWFRYIYCSPQSTYNSLCAVPISSPDLEERWCLDNYNSTDCTRIRDSAQAQTEAALNIFYYCSGGWAVVLLFVAVLAIDTLEHIITKPLVQRSRQWNIPLWLLLPIIGCAGLGIILTIANGSPSGELWVSEFNWVGPAYIGAGVLFLCAAILGWYISNFSIGRTSDKRTKLVAIYFFIACMVSAFLLLITIFSVSIVFSAKFSVAKIDDGVRGSVACFLDSVSCTRCDKQTNRCPQWTAEDVKIVMQTQAKSSATLAAIFFVYAFGAVRFGFTMQKHISTYQIEYV